MSVRTSRIVFALSAVLALAGCSTIDAGTVAHIETGCELTNQAGIAVIPQLAVAMSHVSASPAGTATAIRIQARTIDALAAQLHDPDLQQVALQRSLELRQLADETATIPPGGDVGFARRHATAFTIAWNTDYDALCTSGTAAAVSSAALK